MINIVLGGKHPFGLVHGNSDSDPISASGTMHNVTICQSVSFKPSFNSFSRLRSGPYKLLRLLLSEVLSIPVETAE